MPLSRRQLNRATLDRQMLLERQAMDVVEAVRRVVALQAQEPPSPYVALWNRLENFVPEALDGAFAEHRIVKASLIRITLHAVHQDDYPSFHEAMLPYLRGSRLHDRRFHEARLSVEQVDELIPHLVEFTGQIRTKDEIEAMFRDRLGSEPHGRLWWALRTFAPILHAPTGGPWTFGRRPNYRAAPHVERDDFDQAVQHLLRRYLSAFGPASIPDFGQFSLQYRPAIHAAITALGEELVRHEGPTGEQLFDLPGATIPSGDEPAPPRLLAMWDSVLLAYKDRSRVIPEQYRKVVIRNNGDVLPTVLVDGYVAGVWRPVEDGIEVTAFDGLQDSSWDGIEAEAHALMAMLAGREHLIYNRYKNWWNKLPGGQTRVFET